MKVFEINWKFMTVIYDAQVHDLIQCKTIFRHSKVFHYIFKVGLSPSKKFFILFNESPLEMMKIAFYFILKALFVLRYLSFCLYFLVMWKNDLIRKIRLISKFWRHDQEANNYNTNISQYLLK